MKKNENYWIYGKHAVLAALNNPNRRYFELLVTQLTLESIIADSGFSLTSIACHHRIVSNKELDKLLKGAPAHQGIALRVSAIEGMSVKELIKTLDKPRSVVVVLDSVTDPQNVGSIIRSAVAFGCDAIILPKHNGASESSSLLKASVGTFEKINVCYEANLSNAFKTLKDAGYWVAGLDGYATDDISILRKYEKLVLVLGSEGEGMRKLIKENCDFTAKINIQNTESLNVSNAAAIAFYEIGRK